jgi:hydrogenase maturation factor
VNSGEAQERLKAGKLPPALLSRLLSRLDAAADPSVILAPRPGEDAAVINPGGGYLVAKMDPITFATDRMGWYAVQVNANDIAATGGTPRWFMATLFLPEGSPASVVEEIFGQLQSAAAELGVTLIGGHTEITVGLTRPMISGAMLGEVQPGREISTTGAQPGDAIILTSGIAVEGTAILASEFANELIAAGVSEQTLEAARQFLFDPGISVVQDARVAIESGESGAVHAMHDPTEGGVATGLRELADASETGLLIDAAAVYIYPECAQICDALHVDPWGLIASGSLLVVAKAGVGNDIVAGLRARGRRAEVIGTVTGPEEGILVRESGGTRDLPRFERDEIASLFSSRASSRDAGDRI